MKFEQLIQKLFNKSTKIFLGIFTVIFASIFTGILFAGFFDKNLLGYNSIWTVISTLTWLIMFILIFTAVFRMKQVSKAREIRTLIIIFVSVLIIQIIIGRLLETGPVYDFGAIFNGAGKWTVQGGISGGKDGEMLTLYFLRFYNNRGGLLFLHCIFNFVYLFGITDFYLVATVLNALLIDVAFLLVYLICRKQFGVKLAKMALMLCLFCIPLYYYVPVFYTDPLSMVFIPLIYYLYLLGKDKPLKSKLLYYGLAGISCAVGSMIKMTVLITLAAIIIDIILSCKTKRHIMTLLSPICISVIIIFLFNTLINQYYYSSIIDKEEEYRSRLPVSFWIMLGLNKERTGQYIGEDYNFIFEYENIEKRDIEAKKEIKQRIENFGVVDYLEFLFKKACINFGQGEYGVYYFIKDNPKHSTVLHEFGTEEGKYFSAFRNITQGYHVLLLIFITGSACLLLKRKDLKNISLIPYISIFGLFLFLSLWETNPRLTLNYFPMYIIAAVPAVNYICGKTLKFTR